MLSRDSVTVSVDAVCFYKVPSFFSLWGSIFFQSAFKTFNTYSRFDLFYSRQTFLCVLAFNLLRQLSQSGIFHLSFVKPAHIHLLETIMSPFFHQISPYQITNAAKKKYEKLERYKLVLWVLATVGVPWDQFIRRYMLSTSYISFYPQGGAEHKNAISWKSRSKFVIQAWTTKWWNRIVVTKKKEKNKFFSLRCRTRLPRCVTSGLICTQLTFSWPQVSGTFSEPRWPTMLSFMVRSWKDWDQDN